ncbi:Crp/Fnr family transcriptional regulator [Paenibacillus methanolicus]|uniref:CRP-like cAMP-binding protein n=1 Tax=Paenibacillus methanolicus TaxID=582686 RepID=A0A5S5BQY6_9BACL|nr:Crp/Fnr family transcriptional regulator [Paenibacillus methanolicus]TYP69509.1 CRP-like cAMP-binding protein [Paenibacillus methanolicus]
MSEPMDTLLHEYLRDPQLAQVFPDVLVPHMSLRRFEQGELVCAQGERIEELFVLVKGKLKVYTNTAEGRTLVLCFKTPLEVIGDLEYFSETDVHNTVEAVGTVHTIAIPHKWLRKYGHDHAPLLDFLLRILTRKFLVKSSSTNLNLLYPVEVRLASYLLSVCFDETDADFRGRLPVRRLKDAANSMGTSYRHLNRVIQQFIESGLIEREDGHLVVLDKAGLQVKAADRNIYE